MRKFNVQIEHKIAISFCDKLMIYDAIEIFLNKHTFSIVFQNFIYLQDYDI